jgi:hypothetical protein
MGETYEHEENEGCLQSFLGKPEGKIQFEIAGVSGRIILKCSLKK